MRFIIIRTNAYRLWQPEQPAQLPQQPEAPLSCLRAAQAFASGQPMQCAPRFFAL